MPFQTFFNLPDEKRENLIDAAKKEFSRAPFYEASIANIIKEADIARGSFYQYFEDKEDMYFYLLQKDAETRRENFFWHIKKSNGDLFTALFEEFKSMLTELENEDTKRFYRHVFLNMNYKTEKTFMSNEQYSGFNHNMNDLHERIDTTHLNLINESDLTHIIKISVSIMFQNIIEKFAQNRSDDETIYNYRSQIDLLKRGFEKHRR